jgi:RNA polymerase sigma factor (sigma-70 family)
MSQLAPQELIRRAKAGDLLAYEHLLGPCLKPAARLAYAVLGAPTEAEDVIQEAAIKAWRRLESLRPDSLFRPWFLGIVANEARNERRSQWRSVLILPEVPDPHTSAEDGWLEGEELRRAIARLPHDQRMAILLHFLLDMPIAEVAMALGIGVAGVKSRINRALKRLRPLLTVSEVFVQ